MAPVGSEVQGSTCPRATRRSSDDLGGVNWGVGPVVVAAALGGSEHGAVHHLGGVGAPPLILDVLRHHALQQPECFMKL